MFGAVYLRYVGASLAALGVDLSLFMAGLAVGIAPVTASIAGYSAGIAVHWLVSSRLVFGKRVALPGGGRTRQQMLFVVSALAGLGATVAIVRSGQALGVTPFASKLIAILAGFHVTYLLRKKIVFA
ncbi:GtrA family protein [Allosphingosinicella deserti]|uniref:GtrA family protein n=1 Tax=Allosphingosinicella deserti TaxID=2116704 RepID=A0A2P7QRU5_9SPHN|nr:GtrA family protein [Sphingomonas deserti]PSJ40684.1 GtrA family protein [Sphingomonas deserti]